MTREEAIKRLKFHKDWGFPRHTTEALDIAIADMEKQIPKKPSILKTPDKAVFKCPCCGKVLYEEYYGVANVRYGRKVKHCNECGHALDWTEEGE